MHVLLSDSVSHTQVDAAELMLAEFHKLLPELYGEASCTANAHLLSHLGNMFVCGVHFGHTLHLVLRTKMAKSNIFSMANQTSYISYSSI